MEAMIHALYLLDQLTSTGVAFIFKGGTSLVLLMPRPLRFSVDIDIIVSPRITREELEHYLEQVVASSAFLRVELDERRSYKERIPKAHYKFIYRSNVPTRNRQGERVNAPEREILLDVLFAENPYPVLTERPIQTDWVKVTGEPVYVWTPDINSIAGDKLVAFAPNTTGVPYGVDKEKEIIKQLFDVGNLFLQIDDLETFRQSYHNSATEEIRYRPERNIGSVEAVLQDTINTGLLIAQRGFHDPDDEQSNIRYAEINKGIDQFSHFVFEGNFRIEHAQVASARAAYLAAVLLTGRAEQLKLFTAVNGLQSILIRHPEYNFLNKRLKFVAGGEALYYWLQTLALLYPEASTSAAGSEE